MLFATFCGRASDTELEQRLVSELIDTEEDDVDVDTLELDAAFCGVFTRNLRFTKLMPMSSESIG